MKNTVTLLDSNGSDYEFESAGCIEANGEFYEVLVHDHEYEVIWPHDLEEVPHDLEDLMTRCVAVFDYRAGFRQIESNNMDLANELAKAKDKDGLGYSK